MKSCKFMLILECTEIKVDVTKHILYAKTSDFIIHAIPPPYIGKYCLLLAMLLAQTFLT